MLRRADSSSSRGVPTPLAASTTTSASWWCSAPVAVDVDRRRVARPRASTVDLAHAGAGDQPRAGLIASGQCVRSTLALAPCGQPVSQVP